MNGAIEIPQEVKTMVAKVIKRASTMEIRITNTAENEAHAETLKRVKETYKEIKDKRTSMTGPIDEAKKAIMDFFRPAETALLDIEKRIKEGMAQFAWQEEKRRQEEQRKLEEEARAEEERQRKALEKKAVKQEAKGNEEAAEALRQQKEAVNVEAPQIQTEVKQAAGITTRSTWEAEITNFAKLPDEYKLPNLQKLNAVARETKGTEPIPGVRWIEKKIMAVRSGQ